VTGDRPDATTRRAVLRKGLAVAGATTIAGTSVATAVKSGKLVFTYDDGPVKDYTHTYRKAHRKEGVPGCSAVPSDYVGRSDHLSESQLRTLADEGWEIMSHSVQHRALGDIEVTRDVAADDEKLYVNTNLHGDVEGDTLRVSDGSQSTTVTVAGKGSDSTGEFVDLESAVGESFTASDGVTERYTDDILRTSLGESKRQLEQYGVTVTNMVMPYGAYGKRTQELAGEYYTAVANGGLAIGGRGQIVNPSNAQLPHLSRTMFRRGKSTREELATLLDTIASSDKIAILGGHSWWQERLPPSRIRMAIQMAKDRDIDIVTLRDALADLGITDSTGTTTTTTSQTSSTTTTNANTGTTTTAGTSATTGSDVNAGTTSGNGEFAGNSSGKETSPTTTETNQPGFGVLAALASVGGAAALKRYRDD
jgi:PGF-CTERM protein